MDLFYSLTNCMVCFPGTPQLKINSRSFKILRLLGEVRRFFYSSSLDQRTILNHDAQANTSPQGGFSYVYLVQDTHDQSLYALKKIRCPFGQESVSQALKEVEAYALFAPHPNIIHAIDHSIASDKSDPGAKTVYILLPYYRRGNLQDMINANLVNHTRFPEKRLMHLFLGVCRALKAMHQYKVKDGAESTKRARRVREEAAHADDEAAEEVSKRPGRRRDGEDGGDDVEEQPLMEGEVTRSQEGVAPGQERSYAHRDIKPGEIMSIIAAPHRVLTREQKATL
jgi:serine/threonine kinase 16